MSHWAELQKFVNRCSLEALANLVEEFKVAWVGCFCLDGGFGLCWQVTPRIVCFLVVNSDGAGHFLNLWLLVNLKKKKKKHPWIPTILDD